MMERNQALLLATLTESRRQSTLRELGAGGVHEQIKAIHEFAFAA
jgi:hypothetical protein